MYFIASDDGGGGGGGGAMFCFDSDPIGSNPYRFCTLHFTLHPGSVYINQFEELKEMKYHIAPEDDTVEGVK